MENEFNVTVSDGNKAVLVHGWAGRATQFRRVCWPLLKEGFQVVTDGPAHGKLKGKYQPQEFRTVIEQLVTA
jgi:esterase/lipase